MPKRTYKPSKKKRSRRHGFRVRMRTSKGRSIIKRRKIKKRKTLSS